MTELLAIQRDFAAALADGDAAPRAAQRLRGDGARIAQGLAIYRANAAAAAVKALSAAYPVIRQVVGDEFFDGLARIYERAVPSRSGNLDDFGGDFAAFLAHFPHVQALPYLPDLARLEWLVHRAASAADAKPWNPAGLMAVAPELQGTIRFAWAAGTASIGSAHPLARIWTIHQPDHGGDFAVDWEVAENVLVARAGLQVTVTALDRADAEFFAAALAGATLAAAAGAALDADRAFDLGAVLARAIASNLIQGITTDKEG